MKRGQEDVQEDGRLTSLPVHAAVAVIGSHHSSAIFTMSAPIYPDCLRSCRFSSEREREQQKERQRRQRERNNNKISCGWQSRDAERVTVFRWVRVVNVLTLYGW